MAQSLLNWYNRHIGLVGDESALELRIIQVFALMTRLTDQNPSEAELANGVKSLYDHPIHGKRVKLARHNVVMTSGMQQSSQEVYF